MLALSMSWGKVHATETNPELEHKLAIKQAQQGNFESATKRLNALAQAYPDHPEFIYDYITVLAWAGQDALALEHFSDIDLTQAPAYTLEAIAKAARNQKKFNQSVDIYQQVLTRDPNRKQSLLGTSLSLADAGMADKALKAVQPLLDKNPVPLDALETLAYIQTSRPDLVAALNTYDRILARQADHRSALRGRIMTTLQLGAPHQAAEMAAKHPDVLSTHDWHIINGDKAATTIRWGRLATTNPKQRYHDTDKGIALLEQQLASMADPVSATAVRTRLDLLVAYRERRHMKKSVAEYEELRRQNIDFPAYALIAAADAFLYLRQPDIAVELLENALIQEPYDFEAGTLLFFAYIETENYTAALQHTDKLVEKQADWFNPPGANTRRANPEKFHAKIIAALAHAYADNPAKAQKRLDALLNQAPNNSDLRNELANIYLFRGWPRQALNEFRAVIAVEPDHLGAQAGSVEALAQIGDQSAADAKLAPLLETYADEQRIITLNRQQQTRKLRELWVEVNGGSSTSLFEGNRDFGLEAYLYDKPWTQTLRPYVHGVHQEADFDNATTGYNRIGAGLHFQGRDINLHAEIDGGDGGVGLSMQARQHLNDQLSITAAFDSFSDDAPLRARQVDIDAWSATLGLNYRLNESRQMGVEYQYLDFSDNNQRDNLSAYAQQRLFNTPTYKLDGSVNFYYQQNTALSTPYFNPGKQDALEITLTNEWLTYRHYEQAFRQRLLLTAGKTKQQDYARDNSWALAYEHHWNLNDRLSLAYGVNRSRAVYDGSPEYATSGFINIYSRF